MKRLLFMLCLIALPLYMRAEDIIQILPRTITDIDNPDDCYFEVALENSFDVRNLQFDLLWPDGIEYEEYDMEVDEIRIPYTGTRKKTFLFTFDTNVLSTGYTRYMFTPHTNANNELAVIPSGSGAIMRFYFTVSKTTRPGVYPILMDNILLVKSVQEGGVQTSVSASSYIVIGAGNETATDIDLSGMTGYIPSFVVNQLNEDIASNANLKSLNLSGTTLDNLGADLSVPDNANLLWYTADKASLNRTFTAGNYATVCLPFDVAGSTLNALQTNGCKVLRLSSFNGSDEVTFEETDEMIAGIPYLIKCGPNVTELFKDVDISNAVSISTEPGSTTSGNLSMRGTYVYTEPESTQGLTVYGFKDNEFLGINSGGKGKVQPFRAYIELEGAAGARKLKIAGSTDNATGIETAKDAEALRNTPIYTLEGVKVNEATTKGVYVGNGKKVIVK
ncbi:MAG: hypothetical protein IJ841_00305 [Prevotella sp.]|nr:hypothetical protein [Prevotella sp.]